MAYPSSPLHFFGQRWGFLEYLLGMNHIPVGHLVTLTIYYDNRSNLKTVPERMTLSSAGYRAMHTFLPF